MTKYRLSAVCTILANDDIHHDIIVSLDWKYYDIFSIMNFLPIYSILVFIISFREQLKMPSDFLETTSKLLLTVIKNYRLTFFSVFFYISMIRQLAPTGWENRFPSEYTRQEMSTELQIQT